MSAHSSGQFKKRKRQPMDELPRDRDFDSAWSAYVDGPGKAKGFRKAGRPEKAKKKAKA